MYDFHYLMQWEHKRASVFIDYLDTQSQWLVQLVRKKILGFEKLPYTCTSATCMHTVLIKTETKLKVETNYGMSKENNSAEMHILRYGVVRKTYQHFHPMTE